ncbi:helix-turn-helix domain-containing protein [Streptomyces sp. NPDC086080]|uniref:helix-turn-helix domain-containing protein n=1 Tax=Streptomyces sp. NPDC086080 TaxID=3365748 RepID=UPI0037D4AC3B
MKLLREAAGLTRAQLGERVGYGEAQIASVEQGRRIPRRRAGRERGAGPVPPVRKPRCGDSPSGRS